MGGVGERLISWKKCVLWVGGQVAALLCWGGKKLCWVTCLVLTAGFFARGNGTALWLAKPTRTCFCALTTHPHLAVGSQKSDASFAMRGRCAGQLRIRAPPPSAPFFHRFLFWKWFYNKMELPEPMSAVSKGNRRAWLLSVTSKEFCSMLEVGFS